MSYDLRLREAAHLVSLLPQEKGHALEVLRIAQEIVVGEPGRANVRLVGPDDAVAAGCDRPRQKGRPDPHNISNPAKRANDA